MTSYTVQLYDWIRDLKDVYDLGLFISTFRFDIHFLQRVHLFRLRLVFLDD